MRAVVLGGNGYIGRHLKNLTRVFDDVVLVDHSDPKPADVTYADVRTSIPVSLIGGARPDWLVVLAAVHREPGHQPHEFFETNLVGAHNIVDYAESIDCDKIFFFSSSSVYGATQQAADDHTPPSPTTPYGSSKLAAELIFESWQRQDERRRLVICRPGVVYGPGDPGNVLRMIRAIRRGVFVLPGDPNVHKSYAYIAGLIDSVDFTVSRSEPLIVYNYVERETDTLAGLARTIQDEFDCRRPVVALPTSLVVGAAHVAQVLTAGGSPLHPVRVRKAALPTHIVPRWLIENGFEFRYDFRSSLAHWRRVAPEDFDERPRADKRTRLRVLPSPDDQPPARQLTALPGQSAPPAPDDILEQELGDLRRRFPRVALAHDWLTVPGGSEQVLLALLDMFPDAEVFTSVYDPDPWPAAIRERVVHTSALGRLPRSSRIYPRLMPLMHRAFRSFDLSGFDLIISSSHAFSKSVRAEGVPHVCYCHTPLRLLWEPRFLAGENIGPIARGSLALAQSHLRRVDREGADAVDVIMANSTYTAERIRRYWGRQATVVHPPVQVERFQHVERRPSDTYVVLGRVVPYKRVDLAVAACARLGRPVTIVGEGRDLPRVRAAAAPTGTFLGRVPDAGLPSILSTARAVICCADEDFGIVPVEAQAAGVPVIAYGVGGHRDSVEDGTHGVLFSEQSVESVVSAIERFEDMTFDADAARENASRFSKRHFLRQVARVLDYEAKPLDDSRSGPDEVQLHEPWRTSQSA
jgi:nucleoside-diphosphate-sugar epimerase/glycosyltransferase involved in cell wall biosynthesis